MRQTDHELYQSRLRRSILGRSRGRPSIPDDGAGRLSALLHRQGADHARVLVARLAAIELVAAGRRVDLDRRGLARLDLIRVDIERVDVERVRNCPVFFNVSVTSVLAGIVS